ncbi:hypothetical protein LHP98_13105 [Rhodobacter sp. Har01]|uniref:hypothetical protein n=1 Tax=Rhodobacter sp. Har01 TaxID=2883999 RepID=UPI001D072FAF|nr:hypothetical protein [Rhodobacter sp. Har01]MCB6179058.1 hypothetical protein [Rhodobacter sp. Har01]
MSKAAKSSAKKPARAAAARTPDPKAGTAVAAMLEARNTRPGPAGNPSAMAGKKSAGGKIFR